MDRKNADFCSVLVIRLQTVKAEKGRIPIELIRTAAKTLGVSVRTVWRWVDAGLPSGGDRSRYLLSEEDKELFFQYGGCVAKVSRERSQTDEAISRRTLARAFHSELSKGEREFASSGESGLRDSRLYLRWDRNRGMRSGRPTTNRHPSVSSHSEATGP